MAMMTRMAMTAVMTTAMMLMMMMMTLMARLFLCFRCFTRPRLMLCTRQAAWPQFFLRSPHLSEAMLPLEAIEVLVELARLISLQQFFVLRMHVWLFARGKCPRMIHHEASEVS